MARKADRLRNIAIVAHVDHGKTTLVDRLLQQSGSLSGTGQMPERIMDSHDLERERGITIVSKNTALDWQGYRINIVDTPGHADFGGEVERVLSMVDSVLLLVDAVEGPLPQTRFVTGKAFAMGFCPIVVINKVDRAGARPDWVLDSTFDLFDHLGASAGQLDFPVVYASALRGYAGLDAGIRDGDMSALFQTIVDHVPPPDVDPDGPFQLQVSSLDYNSYVGVIGIGRIARGSIRANAPVVTVRQPDHDRRSGRILQILGFQGLERVTLEEAEAGDIIGFSGIEGLGISDTVCHPDHPEGLPRLTVDEPTISMIIQVNDSPLAGRDGKFLTSRQLSERLHRETLHNVALRVSDTVDPNRFLVSGRGVLHLGILLESMRREGYEFGVSRPEVIVRNIDGSSREPYEQLTVDVAQEYQGQIMEILGQRRGELKSMLPDGKGRVRLEYVIPARGLIGFQGEFMTAASGTGQFFHVFDHYGPIQQGAVALRTNGALISNGTGQALPYALFNLQERGRLLIGPGEAVYEGMVIGLHSRENDLVVNPLRAKQLTNIRAAGKDENILLSPAWRLSLERALEMIRDDELIEATPSTLRIRKKLLLEHERRRHNRLQA